MRAYYPLALVTSNRNIGAGPFNVNDPWILSRWFTVSGGKPASRLTQAVAGHDATQWTRYIPVSRFWPMQFFEGGWLLALSVLLIAATVWLVHRRAA